MRAQRLPAVLLASLAVAGCPKKDATTAPAEAAAEPAADSVHLQFAWTPGWTAKASSDIVSVDTRTGAPDQRRTMKTTFDVATKAFGTDLELVWSNGELVESTQTQGGEPARMPVFLDRIIADMTSLPSNYKITRTGEFAGFTDEAATRKALGEALDGIVENARGEFDPADVEGLQMFDAVVQALSPSFDPAVAMKATASSWYWGVGFWIDAKLDIGAEYSTEWTGIDETSGGELPHVTTFAALDRKPCYDAPGAPACVVLSSITAVQPAAFANALATNAAPVFKALASASKVDLSEVTIESAQSETRRVVYAEPDTLRVWSFYEERQVKTTFDVGGEKTTRDKVETTNTTYTWQ